MSREELVAPFRRLSDTLAQIPSPGPEDTVQQEKLIHILGTVLAALESDSDSAEGSTSSPASDEKAPGESGGWLLEEQEHGLWEEWSDHREGSAVKAAIVKWGTDDLDFFLSLCDREFAPHPKSRINVLTLTISVLLSTPYIPGTPASETLMYRFASHPFLGTVIRSLLLDTSNALFPLALRTVLICLPYAPLTLTPHVPLLMVALGRAACWRDRPFVDSDSPARDAVTTTPLPHPDLGWRVATAASEPPSIPPLGFEPKRIVRLWFVAMYYAWPSNVLAFIRDPGPYLRAKSIKPMYAVSWDDVWPPKLLANRAGPLLRDFALHPSLIQFTSAAELAYEKRWDKNDPSEFVATAHMIAHSELLSGGMFGFLEGEPYIPPTTNLDDLELPVSEAMTPGPAKVPVGEGETEMIRRENEILRLEAKFGDRVRKQLLFHIGRLHSNSLRFNSDEAEIHSFVNRLKEQSKTIASLSAELASQRATASKALDKHQGWQKQLRDKLTEFRNERASWQIEAAKLRSALAELQMLAERQKDELAVVKNERFKLQNQLTESEPKIRHIEDYEVRMQQLTEAQRLWDDDIKKLQNARAEMETWRSRCYQLDQLVRVCENKQKEQAEQIIRLERQAAQRASADRPATPVRPVRSTTAEPQGLPAALKIADEARKRAEAAEREVLDLRVEIQKLTMPDGKEEAGAGAGDRSFIWGRPASPSMFPV